MSGFSNPTLATSFEDVIPIVPSDTIVLDTIPVGLRITNTSAAFAQVTIVTMGGTSRVLDIPPSCVVAEPLRVKQVLVTGTTPGLKIYGYFHN